MDRIGITLRDLSWEDTIACAEQADRVGVDSLWVPESITRRDATLVLAAIAARTCTSPSSPSPADCGAGPIAGA